MSQQAMDLDAFNSLSEDEARTVLRRLCGSTRWVNEMVGRRPLAQFDDLLIAADEAFGTLEVEDWREAFSHEGTIGDSETVPRGPVAAGDEAEDEFGAAVAEQMRATHMRIHKLFGTEG